MRFFFPLLVLIFFSFSFCSRNLIKKKDLQNLNQKYDDKVLVVQKDIHSMGDESSLPALFRKGSRIKIYFEDSVEWVRVKAFLATEPREQARGKIIIYIFEEDLPKKNLALDELEKQLNNFVKEP